MQRRHLFLVWIRRRNRTCCGRKLQLSRSDWLKATLDVMRLTTSLPRTEDSSSCWRNTSASWPNLLPRFRISRTKSPAALNYRWVRFSERFFHLLSDFFIVLGVYGGLQVAGMDFQLRCCTSRGVQSHWYCHPFHAQKYYLSGRMVTHRLYWQTCHVNHHLGGPSTALQAVGNLPPDTNSVIQGKQSGLMYTNNFMIFSCWVQQTCRV